MAKTKQGTEVKKDSNLMEFYDKEHKKGIQHEFAATSVILVKKPKFNKDREFVDSEFRLKIINGIDENGEPLKETVIVLNKTNATVWSYIDKGTTPLTVRYE